MEKYITGMQIAMGSGYLRKEVMEFGGFREIDGSKGVIWRFWSAFSPRRKDLDLY